jgi:hypothetical protein
LCAQFRSSDVDFLRNNPDVMIHFGYASVIDPRAVKYFDLLNLSDRLITGLVYAKHIYMPKEGACQDLQYNAVEMLFTRKWLLEWLRNANDGRFTAYADHRRRIVILQRTPFSRGESGATVSKNKDSLRTWSNEFVALLVQQLSRESYFPSSEFEFIVYSDTNTSLNDCIACQMALFAQAAIVIGAHGAGLANSIYMPSAILDTPGSQLERSTAGGKRGAGIVVEVIPSFDSRHAPGIGIFPRVSALLGLHHFSFYPSVLSLSRSRREIMAIPFNVSEFADNLIRFWRTTF